MVHKHLQEELPHIPCVMHDQWILFSGNDAGVLIVQNQTANLTTSRTHRALKLSISGSQIVNTDYTEKSLGHYYLV